jgi:hypothetical protein
MAIPWDLMQWTRRLPPDRSADASLGFGLEVGDDVLPEQAQCLHDLPMADWAHLEQGYDLVQPRRLVHLRVPDAVVGVTDAEPTALLDQVQG